MRSRLALRLRAQIDFVRFETKAEIGTFVLNIVLLAVALATAIYLMFAAVLASLGLLPYPFGTALGFGGLTTMLIAASVTALLAWLIGAAIHELSLSRAEFERLSRLDPLSGLLNRRAFSDVMAETKVNGFFVLFDVDHFKAVNDAHGHAVGDAVIVAVSQELQRVFEPAHFVSRFGGEEFAVMICGDDRGDCCLLVEQARRSVAARRIETGEGTVSVTLSAGVADHTPQRSFAAIFEAADRALYLAKSFGRDRAVHEDESDELLAPSRRVAAGGRRR
ncbi:GGDEF domain-containing protein [Shinella sp. CPCC 101442]|uniref:GGDEF domain-containing protein n=1 Tax=Shinella sp. CPCC 101442 TaxID=2932265 RepID=UPI002152B9B0|nr:GGDEF domain-containing protein [Shinella sp. CPCC 101442]MCR6501438.1 GGDEF domain-containing protein [Shinella sp. CPCC 101442]